ncbi:hypothetical protein OPT61_g7470 [Boeremia exigua]|uniref:Uncharacterized protein n=1 Tax=Boeremia exigua TaxID=749465 RepID=A0ACC2I2N5_9PLEO|nr:hypothetical protein OPT61_g7470 [Boeremia exigua]
MFSRLRAIFNKTPRAISGPYTSGPKALPVHELKKPLAPAARIFARVSAALAPATPTQDTEPRPVDQSWIFATCLVLVILKTAVVLYHLKFSNALLAGAGVTSIVYAAVQSDPRTSIPICTALLLNYWTFHVAYCWSITRSFRLGEVFIAGTVLAAVLLLGMLSPVPGLAEIWVKSTGLHGVSALVPLHLVTSFASAMFIRNAQQHAGRTHNHRDQDLEMAEDIPLMVTAQSTQETRVQEAPNSGAVS